MARKSATRQAVKPTTRKPTARKPVQKTEKKPKSHLKSTSTQKKAKKTGTSQKNVKKSIIGRLLGIKKKIKLFGIYIIGPDQKPRFVRFRSVMRGDSTIDYAIELVSKFDECSKYVSMDSAKEHLADIRKKNGMSTAKIIEQSREI